MFSQGARSIESQRRTLAIAGLAVLATLFVLALGCRQDVPPLFRRNLAPQTWVSILPADSARGFYSYHVYWAGEDPDGKVVRYIFAITDTISRSADENWDPQIAEDRQRGTWTSKTDSTFTFDSARGRQTFNISAQDDYGKLDPSPARRFFFVVDNGLPFVKWVEVQAKRADLFPCRAADPCTIPNYTSFRIRFAGSTPNGQITGYQWQGIAPGSTGEAVQPLGADSLFLRGGRDTTGYFPGAPGDTMWSLVGNTVSVYYKSSRNKFITPGIFKLKARVRDEAGRISLRATGERHVIVNYDPDTRLQRIPACDCPHPPPNCGGADSVHMGWITGIGVVDSFPRNQWVKFCEGDTLPLGARVRFFARGKDNPRDEAIDPAAGLREAGFSFRFVWRVRDRSGREIASNLNMPFSEEYSPKTLPLPDGSHWRGQSIGWALCPFDYTFYASAVDEHGKRDGSPDSINYFVSGNPEIDSVRVPSVLVFVPTCNPATPGFCYADSFGPDTLAVPGRFIPDSLGATPFRLGFNEFTFPLRAWGHDHARDRVPGRYAGDAGRIRSWRYGFDCVRPLPPDSICDDYVLRGEGNWVAEVPLQGEEDEQTFDAVLPITFALDTLPGAFLGNIKATVRSDKFGTYDFSIQGRDTQDLGQNCPEPSDLNVGAQPSPRGIADLGRTTQVVTRRLVWTSASIARHRGTPKAAGLVRFSNRTRLMK